MEPVTHNGELNAVVPRRTVPARPVAATMAVIGADQCVVTPMARSAGLMVSANGLARALMGPSVRTLGRAFLGRKS